MLSQVFDGEVAAGAAHAGHHLVSDQQHAVAPANFGNLLRIPRRRNHRAERRTAYRFEDERGRFAIGRSIALSNSAAYSCPQFRQPSVQS